jgi:membrane protein
MWYHTAYELVKETGKEFMADRCPRLGAALAFYTALSLSPLLVVVIAIAGFAFGDEAARGEVASQIRGLVGDDGAKAVETMLASHSTGQGILATVIGVVTLVIGASGVFANLQDAIDTVWGVKDEDRPSGLWAMLKDRLWSFSLVFGLAFLLLVSLVISAMLSGLTHWIDGWFPHASIWLGLANGLIALVLTTVMFALMFKVLPHAKPAWSDVWIGAVITALLFALGKYLIGLYLGQAAVGSAYGAAGSFVVLLVWIYYSTQILLFGAEFTQVYAARLGSGLSGGRAKKTEAAGAAGFPAAPATAGA